MSNPEETSNYYSAYKNFAITMRAWLIGFGIGAPVIILTNEKIFSIFSDNIVEAREIAIYFLVGVAIQVGMAFMYMLMMNYFYVNEDKIDKLDAAEQAAEKNKQLKPSAAQYGLNSCFYRTLEYLSHSWKLEMILNAISIVMISIATIKCLNMILPIK